MTKPAERTDLYLMQPRNAGSDAMKIRLRLNDTLNLQDGPVLVRAGVFQPQKGAVLVYHLNRTEDVELVRQQILSLARSSNGHYANVVICTLKEGASRAAIEALPETALIAGDMPGHDADLILLNMIRRMRELRSVAEEKKDALSPFLEVTGQTEQRKLIADAIDSKAVVTISPYGSSYVLGGYFFGYDDDKKRLRCQLTGHLEEVRQFIKEADGSKRLALSLSLKQSRVFFATTDFRWMNESALEIASPSLLYFVQRRRDFRHVVYAEGRHMLEMSVGAKTTGSEALSFDIHDLSEGGLSIICGARDVTLLKKTSIFAGAHFQLEGQTITIDQLMIRHAREFRKQGSSVQYQVGFSFEKIAPGLRAKVATFVNERAARYFQTYLVRR